MKKNISHLSFHQGCPSLDTLKKLSKGGKHNLVVLDDLMSEISASSEGEKLFTRGAHHMNLSIVFVVQNLLYQGKYSRTIGLNSHYLVLFRNLRDSKQIMCLASQINPRNPDIVMDAYEDATEESFGYLLLDLHPRTSSNYLLQTNIFPGDKYTYYRPKR